MSIGDADFYPKLAHILLAPESSIIKDPSPLEKGFFPEDEEGLCVNLGMRDATMSGIDEVLRKEIRDLKMSLKERFGEQLPSETEEMYTELMQGHRKVRV